MQGSFYDTLFIDSIIMPSNGGKDIFISKIDPNGNIIWLQNLGNTGNDDGGLIYFDSLGGFYTTGGYESTVDLDPFSSSYILTSNPGGSSYVQKFASYFDFVTTCENYTSSNGQIWTSSGIYSDTLTNFFGGDSIVFIELTLINNSFISISASSCDSFISPSGNYCWFQSGVYSDTILNTNGCDSIININLNLSYNANVTLNETSCSDYSFNGNILTNSGVYYDTISNSFGCDSVFTLFLTITNVDTSISVDENTLIANNINASYQWIECDDQFLPIPGATNQTFTPTQNGSYACIINQNGCSDTSSCYTISTIGIDENYLSSGIKVYPNPANDKLYIDLNTLISGGRIEIINTLGKVVLQKEIGVSKVIELNIDHLKAGEYIVRIINNEKDIFVRQLIIE